MSSKDLHELFLASAGVCTDTRSLEKNQLFFALKGDNFNGNQYAKAALENGASYAVIDEEAYALDSRYILVTNVLESLQELAAFHRNYLDIPIIGITGSNGKTTSKELLHVVLKAKYSCFATKGNLNNHIGVPLSLLSMNKTHDLAIIEMGANHQKEIASYCNYVNPNYGLITNIGKAHLEGFGGIEGVIKGKTELYDAIEKNGGVVFYNLDDHILREQVKKVSRSLSYGKDPSSDYPYSVDEDSTFVKVHFKESVVNSQLIGSYNAHNIAAAIAIGSYFEVEDAKIKAALEAYAPENNRSQISSFRGNQIILDAYNANPTSMEAALQSFNKLMAPKKIVFLGDMFEVGTDSKKEHQHILDSLKEYRFDVCVLVGKEFKKLDTGAYHFFESTQEAKSWFHQQDFHESTILIKGSRAMRMEDLLKD
ncbi:MAG: UDP-N-acetylmuramoyl-tripeptide--D-alanyl-D-alanine ligase [Bacteroidetes bacterium]|nr:UDP-N-acetylmuramoyl-tripeptide--D-alanyl-D-alanine ligase [Bacteroidota bacterium]